MRVVQELVAQLLVIEKRSNYGCDASFGHGASNLHACHIGKVDTSAAHTMCRALNSSKTMNYGCRRVGALRGRALDVSQNAQFVQGCARCLCVKWNPERYSNPCFRIRTYN